ncbi:gliding motility lipoprotein GldH [Tenacibaculum discolor]|uniref:Gliding motility lipoprotein GldH n=1 Tax=Tenacibaculum discolor TaxID=361581 RepID=A0A2G1BVN0_9FLAO|nr:gliding motility lipoprotein GldH [Tenacibaculum discolor]MDP2540159.1 gliding motility lipoprotein GldH [Tenacibaculum discolor]PHN98107.1 gliding motility lipoprotein GldH [Tenacibaculum discolor]
MKSKIGIFFLVAMLLASCDSNSEFDNYITLPKSAWNKKNTIQFTFPINDSISKKNLFINLRNNKDYAYSNLFLITQMDFPDGQIIIDTLEYDMADVTGKFLGEGFTDIKENKLFYKENITFPRKGEYTFKVRQAMRKNGEIEGVEELEGITHVGFRIEKIK